MLALCSSSLLARTDCYWASSTRGLPLLKTNGSVFEAWLQSGTSRMTSPSLPWTGIALIACYTSAKGRWFGSSLSKKRKALGAANQWFRWPASARWPAKMTCPSQVLPTWGERFTFARRMGDFRWAASLISTLIANKTLNFPSKTNFVRTKFSYLISYVYE